MCFNNNLIENTLLFGLAGMKRVRLVDLFEVSSIEIFEMGGIDLRLLDDAITCKDRYMKTSYGNMKLLSLLFLSVMVVTPC